MKTHPSRLPKSVYIVLIASVVANAAVTFVVLNYLLPA